MKEKFHELLQKLKFERFEQDRGRLCSEFAKEIEGLVFLGFDPKSGEPKFKMIEK